jgi:GMP synthase (glutamine-hydrolysing)
MRPILVIQHTNDSDTGWLGEAIANNGYQERIVQPRLGEALLPNEPVAAVVVLGGSEAAYHEDAHPYLTREKEYIRAADDAGLPILGICLGAQLLADALGGGAHRGHSTEFGYPQIHLTPAGRRDPVLRYLDGPALAWHGDTFTIPPGGVLLAESSRYPYAYRRGTSLGLQFHPEATPEMVNRWLLQTQRSEFEEEGEDPDLLLNQARENETEARRVAHALFSAWLNQIGHA